jgi:CheY-like chemotaxis protein
MSSIMMIDDNPLEHFIMQKRLRPYPKFRDAAYYADGEAAVAFLRRQEGLPDLVFLDLYMPCFSGWDVLEQFALLYPFFNKPVCVYIISSSVNAVDKARAMAYPFVKGYYTKPLQKETMESLYTYYAGEH